MSEGKQEYRLTPSTSLRLEDLQGHLTTVLDYPILAVELATAFDIAFENVVACVQDRIAEAAFLLTARRVWKHLSSVEGFCRIVQAITVKILATHVAPILRVALASVLKLF